MAGKLNVFPHDGHALSMDSTQVGVLEQTNEVSLHCLLKGQDSRPLETEVTLEVLGDLTHKTLEGELADQQVSRLLVMADLAEGKSSRAVAMGLLDTSGGRCGLVSCLGGKLLVGCFASSRLVRGLLGTSHFDGSCYFVVFVKRFCMRSKLIEAIEVEVKSLSRGDRGSRGQMREDGIVRYNNYEEARGRCAPCIRGA